MKLIDFLTKKKYRIIERPAEDGDIKFYPQSRYNWFYWRNVPRPGFRVSPLELRSLETAQEALLEVIEIERKKKHGKPKVHEFNEVFQKLKS